MKRSEIFHPRIFNDKEWAEGYYKRNEWNIAQTGKRLAKILKSGGFETGKVLDAGCGFAAVPIEIARVFSETQIIGIDLAEPLLEIGNRLIHEAGFDQQINLMKGDVHELPFDDNVFNVIICSYMLHLVEDPLKMLNEIERTAKQDARILITDLRRGLLAKISKKLRTALTLEEALEIIGKSSLRPGIPSKGPFWWDYRIGIRKP